MKDLKTDTERASVVKVYAGPKTVNKNLFFKGKVFTRSQIGAN